MLSATPTCVHSLFEAQTVLAAENGDEYEGEHHEDEPCKSHHRDEPNSLVEGLSGGGIREGNCGGGR